MNKEDLFPVWTLLCGVALSLTAMQKISCYASPLLSHSLTQVRLQLSQGHQMAKGLNGAQGHGL